MALIEFENNIFHVDEDGYLVDFAAWSPEWVEYIRNIQGLPELTEEHWRLIHVLQTHYREHDTVPTARMMTEATGFKMTRIFELFPLGPGKGACKLAGLPKPQGCV